MITAIVLSTFFAATPFEDATGFNLEKNGGADEIRISQIQKDGAADSAGLKASDVLLHINGKAVAGLDVEKVSAMVQEKGGTVHHLVVKRDGKPKLVTLKYKKPV